LLFAGEAYNVEMGISNELFPTERDETPNRLHASHPNSITDTEATTTVAMLSSIEKFAFFKRLLVPPAPSTVLLVAAIRAHQSCGSEAHGVVVDSSR
jgi:hypothetical protein